MVLFNSHHYESECKHIEWDEDGKPQEDMWKFQCSIFCNGLLEIKMVMSTLNFKKVNPTQEELEKWLECQDKDVVLALKNALVVLHSERCTSRLCPGNWVEVKQGWAQERKGSVQSVKGDEVLLDDMTSPLSPPVTVWIMDMQKYFSISDHMCLIAGSEVGLDGWCVKVDNRAVQVLEHGTHGEVSSLYFMTHSMPNVSTFLTAGCTRPTSVATVCVLDLETTTSPPKCLPGLWLFEFNAPQVPIWLNLWKGMHICITGALGRKDGYGFICPVLFKGYDAYIQEVNEYWQKDPKDPQDWKVYHHNLPRLQEAFLFYQHSYLCTFGCWPVCL